MQITGYFNKARYRNEGTGYTVFTLQSGDEQITCCGIIPDLIHNTPLTLDGNYGENKNYPNSFCVHEVISFSGDKASDISYICELSDDSLTESEALAALEKLGCSVFDAVGRMDTAEFSVITKLPQKLAAKIYNTTLKVMSFKELLKDILECGGSYSDAAKINDIYDSNALRALKKDPYSLCLRHNIKFAVADHLGERYGFNAYSEKRAVGILRYAIESVLSQGSSFAHIWEIRASIVYIQSVSRLKKLDPYFVLSFLPFDERYWFDGEDRVYDKRIKEFEDNLVQNIKRIVNSAGPVFFDEKLADRVINKAGIKLSAGQSRVFNALKSEGIKIITGGPGVGKTRITNLLIDYLMKYSSEDSICLMAPTGCAAQKLTERSNGIKAETIHARLGVQPYDNEYVSRYGLDNPLPYKYFIIDEMSMTDLEIMSLLSSALPSHSTVILVGDPDQLPSVGAGCVLNDLIASGLFEVYQLTEIYRQSEESRIVDNAELVRQGRTDLTEGEDFHIHEFGTSLQTTEACLKHIKQSDGDDLQVLCPIKKYDAGTRSLNNMIQDMAVHTGPSKVYGEHTYYEGDAVITIRNNREKGYFNGQPAQIKLIDADGMLLVFKHTDNEIYFKNAELCEILPSKALTIHKSQGNEFDRLVLNITEESALMISRQLLYTAVTRSKKQIDLFIQKGSLDHIREDRKRNSILDSRLKKLIC